MGERTYGQWWEWEGDVVAVDVASLTAFCVAAYIAAGCTPEEAAQLAEPAVEKSLQGDHARGVVYLPLAVRAMWAAHERGERVRPHVVRDRGATAVVDGSGAVCAFGMEVAVAKARVHGLGLVGARRGGGVLTPLVRIAVDADMIGVAFSQTGPAVAPHGGVEPLLGNGPFAVGIPTGTHDPVILDMAFTETSASGVLLAAAQGQPIPPGLLLDADGEPTTDPRAFSPDPHADPTAVRARGTLTPLGGGHKGASMLFVLGLLAHVLSDTSPPWDLADDVDGVTPGTVLLAIDPAALSPRDVAAQADAFIDRVASSRRRADVDEILYPGQRSQELKRRRRERGWLELPTPQLDALRALAAELGLPPPAAVEATDG